MSSPEDCWQQGFEHGGNPISGCPYAENSIEGKNWYLGWIQGTLKRLALPYCVELKELVEDKEDQNLG